MSTKRARIKRHRWARGAMANGLECFIVYRVRSKAPLIETQIAVYPDAEEAERNTERLNYLDALRAKGDDAMTALRVASREIQRLAPRRRAGTRAARDYAKARAAADAVMSELDAVEGGILHDA
jgi:DNA-binding sugar fermentation-stimulating protein